MISAWDNAALPGVIMGLAVPFIRQFGSASVGGCGNSERPSLRLMILTGI